MIDLKYKSIIFLFLLSFTLLRKLDTPSMRMPHPVVVS